MKSIVKKTTDITESIEYIEMRQNPISFVFTWIILLIFAGSLVWSYLSELDIVVKASGVVRPDDKVSLIRSKMSGRVSYVAIENGMRVEKGQLLMSIEKSAMKIDENSIRRDIEILVARMRNLKVLENAVTKELQPEKVQPAFSRDYQEYYLQYLDYYNNIEKLTVQIDKEKENFAVINKLYNSGGVSKDEIRESRIRLNSLELEMKIFKNKTIMDIRNLLVQYDKNRTDLENRSKTVNLSIEDADIRAPMAGTVSILNIINRGDLVGAGDEIASIVPDTNAQFKVYLNIKNKDISEVKPGQKIKYRFVALPYKEYGVSHGTIMNIGMDSKPAAGADAGTYFAEATVENKPMTGYNGEVREIKVGMICEAQVVTKRKKILFYLLEILKLKDD